MNDVLESVIDVGSGYFLSIAIMYAAGMDLLILYLTDVNVS